MLRIFFFNFIFILAKTAFWWLTRELPSSPVWFVLNLSLSLWCSYWRQSVTIIISGLPLDICHGCAWMRFVAPTGDRNSCRRRFFSVVGGECLTSPLLISQVDYCFQRSITDLPCLPLPVTDYWLQCLIAVGNSYLLLSDVVHCCPWLIIDFSGWLLISVVNYGCYILVTAEHDCLRLSCHCLGVVVTALE